MTPRPAYLWFLVWIAGYDGRKETYVTSVCGYLRSDVFASEYVGSKNQWRYMYRHGARILRCKVTVDKCAS